MSTTQAYIEDDFVVSEFGERDNSNRYFILVPEDTYQAVCVDVEDLGIVKPTNPTYKAMRKLQLVFQLDLLITEQMVLEAKAAKGLPQVIDEKDQKRIGQRLTIRSKKFSWTLGERSALRPFLESWRGKKFTQEELDGFPIARLVGANAKITVIHNESQDGSTTYANIGVVRPWKSSAGALIESLNYVRKKDRDAQKAAQKTASAAAQQPEIDDEDIPF